MTTPEMETVLYNETLSDFVSAILEHGCDKVARDLLASFQEQATDLAFSVLENKRKAQVASLFKPPES